MARSFIARLLISKLSKLQKFLFIIILANFSSVSFANALWQNTSPRISLKAGADFQHRSLNVEHNLLQQQLWLAPLESSRQPPINIELPLPDGSFIMLSVVESPILSDALAKKHPQIKTFKVYQTDNPSFTGRLDFTPLGFHAMLRTSDGIVYINPESNYTKKAGKTNYRSFKKSSLLPQQPFTCNTKTHKHAIENFSYHVDANYRPAAKKRFGSTIKVYRLALAATSEYNMTVGEGNKNTSLAEMITAINRVNEIYEQDIAVRLKLVTGTELISSNPKDFSNNNGDKLLLENQQWIDDITGSANYDIGHIFSTGGGGLASVGSVCDGDGDGVDEYKAQGVTGLKNPTGEAFYVDYIAHEIGHQLGATHTFNADGAAAGDCSGNRVNQFYSDKITYLASSAYEVGSGSTIMAYAGLCRSQDLQENTDAYFHGRSIEQIRQLIDGDISKAEPDELFWADGSVCGTTVSSGDIPPTADAGDDFIIPANTPFVLTGSATDADSAATTYIYTWEQFDLGNATKSLSAMHTDQGSGPLIRSLPGSTSPERYIPSLSAILSGDLTANIGERLPTTDRILNFRLTLRSGTNGIDQDDMRITVNKNSGPFSVTAPTNSTSFQGYTFVETRWNVANTHLTPIDCKTVDITYSTDGGNTFSTNLLSNTANDGGEYILLPNESTQNGRIKVQCSDNIFFNISPDNLAVSAVTAPPAATLSISDIATTNKADTSSASYTFHISRIGSSSGTSTVTYTVSGSGTNPVTADNFAGAIFPSDTVTFLNGEMLKTVSINLIGQSLILEEKTFTVTLSDAINASINDASGFGTMATTIAETPNIGSGSGKSSNNSSSGSTSFWMILLLLGFSLTRNIKR